MSKQRGKMVAITMILALAAGSLAACGKNGGSVSGSSGSAGGGGVEGSSGITIGLSIGNTTEERWNREIKMFEEYCSKNDITLKEQVANNDANKQISQCENLLNEGIDVLICQSLDAEGAAPIVESAHEAGVKVIAYDRFIMNADLDYYVTFDSVKVGETEANFVVQAAPKGNYIWLKGAQEDNNALLVAEGQKNVLQPYIDSGDITIVSEQWCKGWDPNEALKHTENALSKAGNDIQAVIASNDGTAGGAVQALEAQGLAGKVPICGQDADLAACQRIVEGTQTGTCYKPLQPLNTAACELAVAIAKGEDPKSGVDSSLGEWQTLSNGQKDVDSFTVPVEAIDKDNMYEIIIKRDGFHTLEEVYKNVPKDQWPAQE
ncbi:MAG: substrate-binding domain-containing protein [Lachnospiraceae bacterium]|jgi:D-xylose transport system substrate-binding protein|nr:substrate-binding domain-containing protein [Lachnospiraceae bacterium]MCI1328929.1 substrate-binding domain-containing protein [Lachnospiraceae bacterium]